MGLVGFLPNIISGTPQKEADCVNTTQMGSYAFSEKQERELFFLWLTELNSSRLLILVTFTAVPASSMRTRAQIFLSYVCPVIPMLNQSNQKIDRKTTCKRRTWPEMVSWDRSFPPSLSNIHTHALCVSICVCQCSATCDWMFNSCVFKTRRK